MGRRWVVTGENLELCRECILFSRVLLLVFESTAVYGLRPETPCWWVMGE